MKKCKDIENSLPFYAEGSLSADDKRAMEEHMAECAACSKAKADLKKAAAIMQGISEVEPPPWFKQKIMARVREEDEKKSFTQKWFYPLRIKIPVQMMATIVIVVLAVYIYRSGGEQMKAVLPEARQPVMEVKQEPTPVEILKTKKAAPALLAEKKAAMLGAVKKDVISADVSSGGSALKMEMQENKMASTSDKSLSMEIDGASKKEEKKYTEITAKQEMGRESSLDDFSLSGVAKKSKMFKAAAPAEPRPMPASVAVSLQPVVSVYVADVNSAVVETEKILARYKAKKVTKRLIDDKAILQAEIPFKNLKNVLSQLRAVWRVEEKNIPADIGEQSIAVVIEIKN